MIVHTRVASKWLATDATGWQLVTLEHFSDTTRSGSWFTKRVLRLIRLKLVVKVLFAAEWGRLLFGAERLRVHAKTIITQD